jgi:predicted NUDIX family NTP pyrophosphohydrolase
MAKKSAGILLFRKRGEIEFLLVHPGGPFWKNKDTGAWSVPKGEFDDEEDGLEAAQREFFEETGQQVEGYFIELNPIRQKSGKMVYAWAVEGDFDPAALKSNLFEVEWPPRSGKKQSFPEVDKAAWFNLEKAKEKIVPAQSLLLEDLISRL